MSPQKQGEGDELEREAKPKCRPFSATARAHMLRIAKLMSLDPEGGQPNLLFSFQTELRLRR